MKNNIPLWLLPLVCANYSTHFVYGEDKNYFPPQTQPATQKDSFALPPVRRVGLEPVETNIDEFRNFSRKQDRLLHGVVALPFNEKDIIHNLSEEFLNQTKETGRFWEISLNDFLENPSTQKKSLSAKEIKTNLEQKLEKDYNLDAWIKPTVIFSPDETLVRVTLRGQSTSPQNWAREDILIEAQANKSKINSAFSQALSRLIATLSHDGRVTYRKENFMTVDFGTERGLLRGQKLNAGYVVLSRFHPQSGEFLRSKRVPLFEMKVLEARKGSSLCQITAIDKMKKEQIEKSMDTSKLVMLAWKQEKTNSNANWKEPYDPETAPILGAEESGFGIPLEKKLAPEMPNNIADPQFQVKQKQKQGAQDNKAQKIAQKQGPIQNNDPYQDIETQPIESDLSVKPVFKRRAHWNVVSSWNFLDLQTGLGLSFGSKTQGAQSSFPQTIINRLNASAFMHVDTQYELYARPYVQYSFFTGNSITGNSFFAGTNVYNVAWKNKEEGGFLYLGAGVEITGGTIKETAGETGLSNMQINPSIKWQSNVSQFGKYSLEAGFSLFDIIQSFPVWTFRAEAQPFELITKELVFDVGIKRFKNNWIEYSIGAAWNFEKK